MWDTQGARASNGCNLHISIRNWIGLRCVKWHIFSLFLSPSPLAAHTMQLDSFHFVNIPDVLICRCKPLCRLAVKNCHDSQYTRQWHFHNRNRNCDCIQRAITNFCRASEYFSLNDCYRFRKATHTHTARTEKTACDVCVVKVLSLVANLKWCHKIFTSDGAKHEEMLCVNFNLNEYKVWYVGFLVSFLSSLHNVFYFCPFGSDPWINV